MGDNATLLLSIRSNLPETAQAQIWFRLPRGLSPRSPDRLDRIYLPPYAANQQYSVLIHVEKPGSYPLQASIYATLAGGRMVIQHFYTYLFVTPSQSRAGAEPFDEPMENLPLRTRVGAVRAFRAAAGEVTVRGAVVYFDDNEGVELPVHRPQVSLYLDDPLGKDIKIATTFADERGAYRFENLTNPELKDGRRRDLYVVVRLDNTVLSIENQQRQVYELRSETVRDVPDGETMIDVSLDALNPNRGLGHIFNTIQLEHAFLLNRLDWERDRPVRVVWPGTGSVSYYFAQQLGGQVSTETITIAHGEDQWRRITMFHEYGHAVMTAAYSYNYDAVPTGSYQGDHRLETVSDPGFAFNEGWAEFMEAAVDNRALNVTGFLDQETPNLESNSWWTGHIEGKGLNVRGETVEGAVASILWDIFDTADSIDHQPNVDDDRIPERLDLLWEILINDKPQDITGVAMAWRKRGFPMLEELEEIYATHHALSRLNTAPTFRFTSPPIAGGLADKTFQITWESADLDGDDFTIDLFYDPDGRPRGSALIQAELANLSDFNWNTTFVAEGKYYLRAVVKDSRNGTTDVYSDGFVIVDHTPLLPPIINSTTHPDPARWYADNSPQLDLLTQPTAINARQYSYVLDREPGTIPDTIPDAGIRNNALILVGLGDAAWWVHVRAYDESGYWTDASHFAIKIDSTPPSVVSNLRWVTIPPSLPPLAGGEGQAPTSEITLEWRAVDDTSGIIAYHVQIAVNSRDFQSNLHLDETVDGKVTRYTFTGVPGATYYARVKAENGANLLSRNWSSVTPGYTLNKPPAYDVNRDGVVDITDLVRVASHFGESITAPLAAHPDVNGDGVVDIFDLVLVAKHFGEGINAAPSEARRGGGVGPWKRGSKEMGEWEGREESRAGGSPVHQNGRKGRMEGFVSRFRLARIQAALSALRHQPSPPPNVQVAISALESWLLTVGSHPLAETRGDAVMETRLLPNYPNPFNPETWIPYELAAPAHVTIDIYTATGQRVRRLDLGRKRAGRYHQRALAAYWDGRDAAGEPVASGIYFYVLQVVDSDENGGGDQAYMRKMILLK